MKKIKQFVVLILLINVFCIYGQSQDISFNIHTVDNNFAGPAGIYISDLNNDNRPDIICAGADANTIAWWQNIEGQPITWSRQTIDNDFGTAIYVSAGDIDGDGLTDVLGASWGDHELAWWRNEGGLITSWTKYVIKSLFTKAHEIMPCDLDDDGDLDVLGVSAGLGIISWFENDGQFPVGWTQHNIVTGFNGARSVDADDIDSDGDIDLVCGGNSANEIRWYENDLVNLETVTDYDGNIYHTVVIGNQTWLKENLKSLHYPDGSEITEVWAYDDDEANVETYGRLYTWDGAMNYSTLEGSQGVCPDGWHIPTDSEWTELGTFLGGNNVAGGKLKETGTEHWLSPNTGATNESGFTALPGGEYDDTHYQLLHEYAVMWSSTETSGTYCKYRYLAYNDEALHTYNYYKDFRYSVRCIKNIVTGIDDQGYIEKMIKVSPNPVNDFLSIRFPDKICYPVRIDIYDVTGKLVQTANVNTIDDRVCVSNLHKGLYLLSANIDGKNSIEKFVKK